MEYNNAMYMGIQSSGHNIVNPKITYTVCKEKNEGTKENKGYTMMQALYLL